MSLRSPLGRVLGLGSARGGASHWYAQRVTAVALVLLALWLVVSLASLADASYEQVTGWLRWPLNSALALLLVIVSAWHAVLGLQVVVEDYVADKGKRLLVLIAIKFAFVVAAVVGVLAVLRIAFGVAA
jgi:succinate dehydrogenase / fumarate reductase, membrane anchor subunit